MKRLIAILITITLFAISTSSFAENKKDFSGEVFDIRNGIGFNATLSSIKSVESKNTDVEFFSYSSGILSYKGKIAGYDSSQVFYSFDGGKLSYLYYRLGATFDGINKYSDMKNSLVAKYGDPDLSDITWSTTSDPLFVHNYSSYELYSQWFVEYNDCYVVITLYTTDFWGSLGCMLKYDLYSHSEMRILMAQYQKQLDDIKKQRQSDI